MNMVLSDVEETVYTVDEHSNVQVRAQVTAQLSPNKGLSRDIFQRTDKQTEQRDAVCARRLGRLGA